MLRCALALLTLAGGACAPLLSVSVCAAPGTATEAALCFELLALRQALVAMVTAAADHSAALGHAAAAGADALSGGDRAAPPPPADSPHGEEERAADDDGARAGAAAENDNVDAAGASWEQEQQEQQWQQPGDAEFAVDGGAQDAHGQLCVPDGGGGGFVHFETMMPQSDEQAAAMAAAFAQMAGAAAQMAGAINGGAPGMFQIAADGDSDAPANVEVELLPAGELSEPALEAPPADAEEAEAAGAAAAAAGSGGGEAEASMFSRFFG